MIRRLAVFIPLLLLWACSEPEAPREPRRFKVTRGDVIVAVSSSNSEVRPLVQVELKSKASGKVLWFPKREGDPVKAGEVLLRLEKETELRNHERARSDLESAKARLNLLSVEYDHQATKAKAEAEAAQVEYTIRMRELERLKGLGDSVVKKQEIDAAELAAVNAKARHDKALADVEYLKKKLKDDQVLQQEAVTQATLAFKDAEERLRDTEIVSPIDGILLKKLIEEGQIVASGINAASGGTPLLVVADTRVLIVEAKVDETEIGKIKVNQEARISVDAAPGKTFNGTVQQILPSAEQEQGVPFFRVRVAVEGRENSELRVGMTANVDIIIDRRANVLRLPLEAVRYRKNEAYVSIEQGQQTVERTIKVGAEGKEFVEITEGLSENDPVVVPVPNSSQMGPRVRMRYR